MVRKDTLLDELSYVLDYAYDAAGQLTQMVYPSGMTVYYQRNAAGQLTAVTALPLGGAPRPLATALQYEPFGPPRAWTHGNGLSRTVTLDGAYRVTGLRDGAPTGNVFDWTLAYDAADNVTSIVDHQNGMHTQTLSYDARAQVVGFVNGWGLSQTYAYDGIDNLLGVFRFDAGPATVTLSDAADGYVIADAVHLVPPGAGPNTVTWNPPLTQAAEYEVLAQWTSHPNRATNAQYIITHAQGTDTITVNQQQNGGTFNSLGTFTLDAHSTIQLTDEANGYVIADAVKIIRTTTPPPAQAGIYYYVNDHLGTPQTIMDQNQNIVWAADYEPFGQATITTETLTNNLRFPGQYFDAESGLHHNGFRPYDPGTGRYIQSDQIGLLGGINTYAYVGNNPSKYADPLGLYVGFWHSQYTRMGGELAGLTPLEAAALAQMVVDVDNDHIHPGTQDPANAHMHAMCAPGMSSTSCQERYLRYIEEQITSCDKDSLAKAIHAVQDSYAEGHRNFEPYNGLIYLPPSHLYHDSLPTPEEMQGVPFMTQNVIELFRENCSCSK